MSAPKDSDIILAGERFPLEATYAGVDFLEGVIGLPAPALRPAFRATEASWIAYLLASLGTDRDPDNTAETLGVLMDLIRRGAGEP